MVTDPKTGMQFQNQADADHRPPDPPLRRIVTGHAPDGRAVAAIDGPATNHKWSGRGTISTLMWSTDETPAEMWTGEDYGARIVGTQPPPNGSRFAVIEFAPGTPGRMHRTDTVDYVFVLSGEIDMDMDDSTVHLKAGDMLVQQGTNHSWENRSDKPCRVAFALIDGKPAPGGSLAIREKMPPTPRPKENPPASAQMRRVVTSHDETGKALVMWDGPPPLWAKRERGNYTTLVWGTDETPCETWDRKDWGNLPNEIEPPPGGTWCRVIDYPPGTQGRMHRTDTIDYVICLKGRIDMDMDDSKVTLNTGEIMVQMGTNHSWENRYDEDCRIAFVLLDAKKPQGKDPRWTINKDGTTSKP